MNLNILVGDVMTKRIVRVDINDTIDKAAKMMRDNNIGSVVVMGDKQVKGILTTSDIVYKHVAGKRGPLAKDVMTEQLLTIRPSDNIEQAARMMVKHNVEKLLVFDKSSLVGIITNNDIIRVEPAIVEILLERMKMRGTPVKSEENILECESCGNYSDSIEESNGVYLCQECRGESSVSSESY